MSRFVHVRAWLLVALMCRLRDTSFTAGLAFVFSCGAPLPASDLPAIEIHLGAGGEDALEAAPRANERFTASLVAGRRAHLVQVRYRGQTSRIAAKRSWSVWLAPGEAVVDPATGARVEELNLLAEYDDPSQVRNLLSHDLLGEAGALAPRAGPLLLVVDGCWRGVYTSIEEVDHRMLAERFGDAGTDAPLYEAGRACAALMTPATRGCYRRIGREGADPLPLLLDELARVADKDFRAWLERTFDVDSLLGWLAVTYVVGNWDAFHKNYDLAHVGGRWWWIPWDYDMSFGRRHQPGCGFACLDLDFANSLDTRGNVLIERLLANPKLKALLLARIGALLAGPLAPAEFGSRLDALWSRLGPAIEADPERRPLDARAAFDDLRRFAAGRRAFLEKSLGVR